MRLSQSILPSVSRTQRSLIAPAAEDQEINLPSTFLPAGHLPFVLEGAFSVATSDPKTVSVMGSEFLALGAIDAKSIVFLDRGLWDVSWTFSICCAVANAAARVNLQLNNLGPTGMATRLAEFAAVAGYGCQQGRFTISLGDNGCGFSIASDFGVGPTGFIFGSISAQKLL